MVLELDERIDQELKELYKTLEIEGKLLSGEQLAGYYSTFRSRFGPDRLKNLDGEALLNTMHDIQNRDGLVYWLEFKDDEEFPSRDFGSIAGGSAFEFRSSTLLVKRACCHSNSVKLFRQIVE